MLFNIITIFPKIFDSYFNESIIKRAQKKGQIKIKIHNLRDYAADKHKTVDDKPYGGGPGMIMKVEPVYGCLQKIASRTARFANLNQKDLGQVNNIIPLRGIKQSLKGNNLTLLFTPTGKKFNQAMARRLTKFKQITLLCPRYEGHDARIEKLVAEKISVGDYILTGGEIPAMIVVDAVTRLLPGVIKNESLKEESFASLKIKNYKLKINKEHPHYTRPENFKGMRVPKVLLSGNHKKIQEWQKKTSQTV